MKIAIIGAGAAGCFAAANLPHMPGREVVVFEKTTKPLQKVRVSGGGRCNVTHDCNDIPELLSRYPRGRPLLRKSLYAFGPAATTQWFERRGVRLKTEGDGRMFPVTDNSQTITDCLWAAMMENKVQVIYNKAATGITRENNQLTISFTDGSSFTADKVLIATGGGHKPEHYAWLRALGHTIEAPVPSLFTFNLPDSALQSLMGVSVAEATVKIAGTKIRTHGPALITHWGLSGPAILKASAIGARDLAGSNYRFTVVINWLGETSEGELRDRITLLRQTTGSQQVAGKNSFGLPKRLWEHLAGTAGITENVRWGDLKAEQQNKLVNLLTGSEYMVSGKTTFKEEFVTCGGIALNEIDAGTMQSRLVHGLYFAGEILDVDGITGGYNFQHAWSSAWVAADHIKRQTNERS